MLFATHAPYSEFCKDGLMIVSRLKRVAKIKIEINIDVFHRNQRIFPFILMQVYLKIVLFSRNNCCRQTTISIKNPESWHVDVVTGKKIAGTVLCCHLWPLWQYPIFQQYHTKDTVFEKTYLTSNVFMLTFSKRFPEIQFFFKLFSLIPT